VTTADQAVQEAQVILAFANSLSESGIMTDVNYGPGKDLIVEFARSIFREREASWVDSITVNQNFGGEKKC
jgi:hypothetical protein